MDKSCELYREIMARVEHLPPMPDTISRVMEMSRKDDYSTSQLAEVVCRDPTLAARVLKLCNSGFVGLSQEVSSIQRAVMYLGFEMVKNLVFSSFIHSVMQADVSGYAQNAQSLWEHSLGTATASLIIAEKKAPEMSETAYTGGLIHDIGKVILASFMGSEFEKVIERMRKYRIRSYEAEQYVLGTTHQEIGGVVAERWRIAVELKEAIEWHHDPAGAENAKKLAAIICLADAICGMLGVGAGLEATDGSIPPGAMEIIGIDDKGLEDISSEIMRRTLALKNSDVLNAF